jgi:hypothetical protein
MNKGSYVFIFILTAVLFSTCSEAGLEKGSTEGASGMPAPSSDQAQVEDVRGEPLSLNVLSSSPSRDQLDPPFARARRAAP